MTTPDFLRVCQVPVHVSSWPLTLGEKLEGLVNSRRRGVGTIICLKFSLKSFEKWIIYYKFTQEKCTVHFFLFTEDEENPKSVLKYLYYLKKKQTNKEINKPCCLKLSIFLCGPELYRCGYALSRVRRIISFSIWVWYLLNNFPGSPVLALHSLRLSYIPFINSLHFIHPLERWLTFWLFLPFGYNK